MSDSVDFYDFIAVVMYLWWSGELVASELRLLLFSGSVKSVTLSAATCTRPQLQKTLWAQKGAAIGSMSKVRRSKHHHFKSKNS